jgi:hypothetical protein
MVAKLPFVPVTVVSVVKTRCKPVPAWGSVRLEPV